MAKTAPSDVALESPINPSNANTIVEWGILADAYKVGDVVYLSQATGKWTKQSSAAGQLQKSGVIGYDKNRMKSDYTAAGIDDAYAADDRAPIITKGEGIISILDQNATLANQSLLGLSATAGSLTVIGASTAYPRAILTEEVVDDDVYCKAQIGGL